MKLYSFVPQDCSGKVRWLLLELGVSFQEQKISYKAGDTKTAEYLQKHPLGQVPVLEDGTLTLFESYAIVAYLADKYLDQGLAPDVKNMVQRGEYHKWMFFSSDSAGAFFSKYHKLSKMTDDYLKEWGDHVRSKTQMVLLTLEKQLAHQDYILGKFSAVDICLGYELDSMSEEGLFKDFPKVSAYFERLKNREACLRSEIFKRN